MLAPDARRILAIRLLGFAGAIVAGYSAFASFGGPMIVGCGGAHCLEILRTRWAYWLGIPVSILALAVYAVVIVATFCLKNSRSPGRIEKSWKVLLTCAAITLGAAAWFVLLQAFVINRICTICLLSHSLGVITSGLILLPQRAAASLNQINKRMPVMLGLSALVPLILGQILFQAPTHQMRKVVAGAIVTGSTSRKTLQIFGGQFSLDLGNVPIKGSQDAPHVMVCLLDYTCGGCRILHGQLNDAAQVFSNQLAVVWLLAPLDSACNPAIHGVYAEHSNACDYARLALAVWGKDREGFAYFQDWLMSSSTAPSLDDAKRYAAKWLGHSDSASFASNSVVEQHLAQGLNVYGAVRAQLDKDAMPLLIIGDRVIMGAFRNSAELSTVLMKELNLDTAGMR